MKLVNENYEAIDTEVTDNDNFFQHFFEYDPLELDMFLVQKMFWYSSDPVRWYTLAFGRRIIRLPETIFVMIGDVYSSSVDWIPVEELVQREMTSFVYPNTLTPDGWTVDPIRLLTADTEEKPFQLPFTKNILPVMLGSDKAIFISDKDCYTRTKNIEFPNFYDRA